MLNHLSWTSYFETACLLLAIYYVFIGLRYYAPELRRLVNPANKNTNAALPDALRYEVPDEVSYLGGYNENQADDPQYDADSLLGQVKQYIKAASTQPFSPETLMPQLKKLFQENLQLKNSPHRPAINELVVAECERTGTALLNEDEVDEWWNG